MAKEGCVHGTVVLSHKQTAGRGRFNRSFYSPEGTGLYMSIVLDADKLCLDEYTLLTPLVAVITSKVIDSVAGKKCGIKWVNDLYLEGKKVCGILCERVENAVVIGIGINLSVKAFPNEIKNIAVNLGKINRKKLAKNIVNEILSMLKSEEDFIERLKSSVYVVLWR